MSGHCDYNDDGSVSMVDFTALLANFDQMSPGPALGSLLPELIGAVFLLPSSQFLLPRRRKRL